MNFEALVEHTRGPMAEIVHAGAIAVVNAHGQWQASVGDRRAMAFTRSTLKPFQALPFLQADGVQVIASVQRREAIAIKIISGHMPALYAAAVETMDQLGWLDAQQRELLGPWRYQTLLNARGKQVGEVRPVFSLGAI